MNGQNFIIVTRKQPVVLQIKIDYMNKTFTKILPKDIKTRKMAITLRSVVK